MFKVVTKNSVYTVSPEGAGFTVSRTADMWGHKVNDRKSHFTGYIRVVIGSPFVTSVLRTTAVLAVIPA